MQMVLVNVKVKLFETKIMAKEQPIRIIETHSIEL